MTFVHILGGCNLDKGYVSQRHLSLNLATSLVSKCEDLPRPKFGHATAICGNKIVITSGVSDHKTNMGMRSVPIAESDCYTYDIKDKNYECLPDVPIGKFNPALVVVNNRFVFQIGGYDDWDFDIYRFDMRHPDAWATLSLDTSSAIVDDLIYEETKNHLLAVQEQDRIRKLL